MAGNKAPKTAQLGSAGKENHPPKPKQTVWVSGLFDQKHRSRRIGDKDTYDVLAPRAAGVSKPRDAKPGFFAQFHRPKQSEIHPISRSFAEAANDYRNGMAASKGQELEPVYQELIARVDGLDIKGRQLDIPNIPAKGIAELAKDGSALTKSLDHEKMTLQETRKDGTVTMTEVTLGSTMASFQKVVSNRRAELEGLLKELDDVNAEIAAAQNDALRTEEDEVRKANDELNGVLQATAQEAKAIKDETLAQVKKARKEDQAIQAELNRKFEDFMRSLV